MLFFFIVIWQLPQNLLGLILRIYLWKYIIEKRKFRDTIVYLIKGNFTGASLGIFIFVNEKHSNVDQTILHEFGHFRQSILFGWFYLIIIGVPSIIMNILTQLKILKFENYYTRWPENWADKLGKVERS